MIGVSKNVSLPTTKSYISSYDNTDVCVGERVYINKHTSEKVLAFWI